MKNTIKLRQVAAALAAVVAFAGLSTTAMALPLTWINGPQAGQPFFGGPIQIKAVNYDTGTLYNPLAPLGSSIGYSGSPGAGVAGGEATLNLPANVARPVLNGMPATEDSWGILRITQIQSTASDGTLKDVYNEVVSPFELTGMFWGVKDFFLQQVSAGSGLPASGQVIDGTGFNLNIYSDPSKNFSQVAGPAGRGGVSTYATATDGTLELSLLSTPGFINANGTFGGAATEFESNTANVGYSAMNVIGGASALQFDSNRMGFGGSSGASFVPGVAGQAAMDVWLSFTSSQGVNGWDITSNDPMLAVTVPDAGSTLMLFITGLALVLGARRSWKRQ